MSTSVALASPPWPSGPRVDTVWGRAAGGQRQEGCVAHRHVTKRQVDCGSGGLATLNGGEHTGTGTQTERSPRPGPSVHHCPLPTWSFPCRVHGQPFAVGSQHGPLACAHGHALTDVPQTQERPACRTRVVRGPRRLAHAAHVLALVPLSTAQLHVRRSQATGWLRSPAGVLHPCEAGSWLPLWGATGQGV